MSDIEAIEFTPEAIPAQPRRVGGEGRAPIAWEEKIASLKDRAGESFRAWTYTKKSGASSRVSSIRNRLYEVTPEDNWTLAVRVVPDTDPELYGVYIQFNGVYTPEEVAENAKVRQARSDSIKTARAAAEAATTATSAPTADTPAPAKAVQTPAQKVAAAKAAAAKK